jgi:hypothetical protein
MRNWARCDGVRWLMVATCGLAGLLAGCDATVQTTVQNGVITISQTLLTDVMRAAVAWFQEVNK